MDYEGYFNRYLSQRPSVWKTADGILKSPERFPMTASFTSDEEMFLNRNKREILNAWYWQKRRIIMEIFRFAELEQMNLWVGCVARVQKRSQREFIIA